MLSKNLKISIVIKNIIGFEDTLMHKAERPGIFSNSFTHYQADKKRVICGQILLEIHQTEHSLVQFQGEHLRNSYCFLLVHLTI